MPWQNMIQKTYHQLHNHKCWIWTVLQNGRTKLSAVADRSRAPPASEVPSAAASYLSFLAPCNPPQRSILQAASAPAGKPPPTTTSLALPSPRSASSPAHARSSVLLQPTLCHPMAMEFSQFLPCREQRPRTETKGKSAGRREQPASIGCALHPPRPQPGAPVGRRPPAGRQIGARRSPPSRSIAIHASLLPPVGVRLCPRLSFDSGESRADKAVESRGWGEVRWTGGDE